MPIKIKQYQIFTTIMISGLALIFVLASFMGQYRQQDVMARVIYADSSITAILVSDNDPTQSEVIIRVYDDSEYELEVSDLKFNDVPVSTTPDKFIIDESTTVITLTHGIHKPLGDVIRVEGVIKVSDKVVSFKQSFY